MSINYKDITIFLVAYHSKFQIEKILQKLNTNIQIIIIENSNLIQTKEYFEKKYKNIKVILSQENNGQTGGINIGFKNIYTKYGIYIDMDVKFDINIVEKFYNIAEKLKNFIILAPEHHRGQYKKHFIAESSILNNLQKMKMVHGHFLFFNMENVKKFGDYDENIFFYFDETDYCLRAYRKGYDIFVVKDIKVEHEDGKSYEQFNWEIEYLKHWHLLWGKFYFYKKNYNYLFAILKTLPDLIESLVKAPILFFFNKNKYFVYKNRLAGLLNSMMLKPSWKRLLE